jgi:hypothetical protein
VPPSCFALVSPLNFWQVIASGKALGSMVLPKSDLHSAIASCTLIFGNALDLGLYPTQTKANKEEKIGKDNFQTQANFLKKKKQE